MPAAGDGVAIGFAFLGTPRNENIEVHIHQTRQAVEIGRAVTIPEQDCFPFSTLHPDRVSGKQEVMLAIVPQESGRASRVSRCRDDFEVIADLLPPREGSGNRQSGAAAIVLMREYGHIQIGRAVDSFMMVIDQEPVRPPQFEDAARRVCNARSLYRMMFP